MNNQNTSPKESSDQATSDEGLDDAACSSMLDEAPRLLMDVSAALASPKARKNIVFDPNHLSALSRYLKDLAKTIETMNGQKCTDGNECGIGGYCKQCPDGWTATHWTKSYEGAPFGCLSPLEQIELYRGERQIAVIPVDVFKQMVAEIMPIIETNAHVDAPAHD